MEDYKIYRIPKGNGKWRTIASPSDGLKRQSQNYLDIFNTELDELGLWNSLVGSCNHAYINGRSCKTLVDKIYKFVADCKDYDIFSIDIKDFFGSITMEQIIDSFRAICDWHITNGRVTGPNLSCPNMWAATWVMIHPSQFKDGIGIAQGNPLSPLIANLVGFRYIDNAFYSLFSFGGRGWFTYLRYCDNVYIIAKRHEDYSRDSIYKYIKCALEQNKWLRNFKYTMSVRGNHAGNTILGIRLGATKSQLVDKKWLRNLLHRVKTLGTGVLGHKDVKERFGKNLTYEVFCVKLQGLISYATYIDPTIGNLIDKYNIPELGGDDEGL